MNDAEYLFAELSGSSLIRIHHENPLRLDSGNCSVSLKPNRHERIGYDARAGLRRSIHRFIRRAILDDYYLSSPAHTVDARRDIRRFISRGDYYRDRSLSDGGLPPRSHRSSRSRGTLARRVTSPLHPSQAAALRLREVSPRSPPSLKRPPPEREYR